MASNIYLHIFYYWWSSSWHSVGQSILWTRWPNQMDCYIGTNCWILNSPAFHLLSFTQKPQWRWTNHSPAFYICSRFGLHLPWFISSSKLYVIYSWSTVPSCLNLFSNFRFSIGLQRDHLLPPQRTKNHCNYTQLHRATLLFILCCYFPEWDRW